MNTSVRCQLEDFLKEPVDVYELDIFSRQKDIEFKREELSITHKPEDSEVYKEAAVSLASAIVLPRPLP